MSGLAVTHVNTECSVWVAGGAGAELRTILAPRAGCQLRGWGGGGLLSFLSQKEVLGLGPLVCSWTSVSPSAEWVIRDALISEPPRPALIHSDSDGIEDV